MVHEEDINTITSMLLHRGFAFVPASGGGGFIVKVTDGHVDRDVQSELHEKMLEYMDVARFEYSEALYDAIKGSVLGHALEPSRIDARHDMLSFLNGVVVLRAGTGIEILPPGSPARPTGHHTFIRIPRAFQLVRGTPHLDRFLLDITGDNARLRDDVLDLLARCLLPGNPDRVAWLLLGPGSDELVSVLRMVVSEANVCSHSLKVLATVDRLKAQLVGKLLNVGGMLHEPLDEAERAAFTDTVQAPVFHVPLARGASIDVNVTWKHVFTCDAPSVIESLGDLSASLRVIQLDGLPGRVRLDEARLRAELDAITTLLLERACSLVAGPSPSLALAAGDERGSNDLVSILEIVEQPVPERAPPPREGILVEWVPPPRGARCEARTDVDR